MSLIGKKYLNLYSYDVKYLNMNKDPVLRKDVVSFFKNKIKKWIKKDDNFKHLKNRLDDIDDKFIYNLIKNYVKKHKYNWYDLRTEKYHLIKDYFSRKL
jgi:uncharacterized protein with ATP-grasp and redox domains